MINRVKTDQQLTNPELAADLRWCTSSGDYHRDLTTERPMVVGGKIEVRPMMYLALSYDHRIVDGREAVTFLVRVKESLEDPARLVLDL